MLAGIPTWLTYGLILWAMTSAQVSCVASDRESSILFVTLFGWLVLREPHSVQRLLGAARIGLGVVCIALAQ